MLIRKDSRTERRVIFSLAVLLMTSQVTLAQPPADSEIYLVDIALNRQPAEVSKPVNTTQRKGYNNQPSFTPDGNGLLYTAMQTDGQTDIHRYDLSSKTTVRLTRTPESEYSPTVTPDQAHFSVVRVEKDQTQRLWQFPINSAGEPTLVLEKIKPVGYHCWLDADELALFILGKPNSLQLARVSTGDTIRVATNIGRAIHKVPGKNAISFVHKRTPTDWEISQLDLKSRQLTVITRTLDGSEDFVWTPDGTLLMCRGPILYQYKPGGQANWLQLADFSANGIKQLTRLAIDSSGKKLALVGQ